MYQDTPLVPSYCPSKRKIEPKMLTHAILCRRHEANASARFQLSAKVSCGLNTIAGRHSFYAHGTRAAKGERLSRHMSVSSFQQCFFSPPAQSYALVLLSFCREVHHEVVMREFVSPTRSVA